MVRQWSFLIPIRYFTGARKCFEGILDWELHGPEIGRAASFWSAHRPTPAAHGRAGASRITSRLDVDDIIIDVDHAVACGQIISELLSNSLKHAFPNGQSGNIEVSLHQRNGGWFELIVADDGMGLPEDFDLTRAETLGMRLVHALALQLSGVVKIDGSGGTCVQVTFPEKRS